MSSGSGLRRSTMPTSVIACTSTWLNGNSKSRRKNPAVQATTSGQAQKKKRYQPEWENNQGARGGIMIDLTTHYLGLKLRTPLVPSASPLSQETDSIRRLEDAGAAAVVLYSLFEEQLRQESLELDHHLSAGTESFS